MIGPAGSDRSTRDSFKSGFFKLMAEAEQRRTERIQLRIPIRVVAFSEATGEFSEDTHTLVVNRAGARIALNRNVMADDVVRIINLENYREADFRVVGPLRLADAPVAEWGVECVETDRNVWGIDFPPPLASEAEAAALLECRACHSQGLWPVTLMEVEVLDSTGVVTRACDACGKTTYWTYADATRRPRELSPSDPVAPPKREVKVKEQVEKRAEKRLALKLPILVRNQKGVEEIAKTENVSKHGVAVSLAIEIAVGETVDIVCPYTRGGEKIWQKAETRQRGALPFGGMRLYGFHYIR